MPDTTSPIASLEVSKLSAAVFARLGLRTISDLLAVDALTFLDTAYEIARDTDRVAPALREVNEILAELDRRLAPAVLPPLERRVANDGAALAGYAYQGTFHCAGALVFGEHRFIGRSADAHQHEGTIDFSVVPPKTRVRTIDLGSLDVEPGLWDVYERGRAYNAIAVRVQHRNADRSDKLRYIGGLRLPDPLVVVVDAVHAKDARASMRGRPRQVFDWGFTTRLSVVLEESGQPMTNAEDVGYEWSAYTDGRAIRALEVHAYWGEEPSI